MRRKNRKYKQEEAETSASEKAESSELDNTIEDNQDEDNSSDTPEPETKRRKKVSFSPKKAAKERKDKEEKENAQTDTDNGDVQHEVESIVDEKMVRGVKHYLIRWKGFSEDSDTWEPEDTLNCPDLLKQFYSNRKNNTTSKSKKHKDTKSKNKKRNSIRERGSKDSKDEENWDENEEFEVDRIIEVHHKRDGKREFLVSWKGYPQSQNSWVLEEDMTCNDLIAKFMAKVERARQSEQKDLRVKPAHTDRFTLSTSEPGRRLSKRNSGKQSNDRSATRGRKGTVPRRGINKSSTI